MVAGTPSERDHSAELLGTVLDALRDDPSQDVESIVRCHPGHEAEIRQLAEVVRIVRSGADGPLRDPTFDIDTLRAFGTVTIDDFRLLNEVGRGGMGVVFEAEQVSLARRVAIKLLAPGVRLSTRSVERFRREAAAAGSLHHTNIVPVYATGIWEGVPYYAMQFIEGRSLCQRIGEARSDGRGAGLLEPRLVLRWGHAIADALAHAHRHGVLHRDIKPSNIIIDRAEDPWITDFGLARCDASVSITMTGDIVGTVRYMSPEQARGGRAVDERADLYSLGATLFEALCGRPVFEGDDRDATLRRLLVERAPGVRSVRPDVPDDCAAIIDRLLEKEPERRYPSAAVLAEDLRRAIAGEALLLRPPGRLELARRFVQRHTLAVTLSAVAAAVLVAFSIGTFVLAMNLASERDRARQEAGRVDRVNDYLSKILALGGPRPGAANLSMRDALDVIVPEIGVEFANDPRTQAPLRLTVARLYWQWGELAKAEEQFRLSFESARIGFGLVSDEAIAAGTELASLLVFRGRLDAAGAVLGELDGRNRSVMLVHGHLRFAQERITEARDLAAAVLEAKDDRCIETSIQALDLLARASVCLGERAGAIAARREAMRLAQQDRVARGPGGRAVDAENIEATAT
ncbi:MAG: protein kinase, partial [Phycisphaerae bacterium]|nr:protein kinase [Phycisphaerae bacterium]